MTVRAIEAHDIVMRFPQQQGWAALFRRTPGKVALDHIDLDVREGEIFGLLGPNGAGKTTLVKILCTLTIPTGGWARVLGLDPVRDSLELRRRIGVVYGDERAFFWRLSALENLMFYASLYGLPPAAARARAEEVLELVGLSGSANVRMLHYSSGMRQRTSIARGLLNDPNLLIMDEPTRTLDPVASLEIRRLVRERVATGRRTVLIATNIMAEAEALCDRLAFINHGRVQTTGTIDELRSLIEVDEIYELVVSHLDLDAVRRIDGVESAEVERTPESELLLRINVRRGSRAVPDVIRSVVDAGGDVWSCARRDMSIDEMFTVLAQRTTVATNGRRPEAVLV